MIEPKATSRPAQKYGNRGAWQAEADHLRAHPDDTFIIERRPYPDKAMYALAAHVRSGGYVAFRPAGSYDAWVERAGDQLEVIAVYTGPAEGTHAPEPTKTVASPAPVTTKDSGGEVESFSALRARLETLPPGDRSDAVVAWIGTLPLDDQFELITAMTVEHLAETGQSFDDWWREGTGQSFDDWCRARGLADADPKPARKKRTVATRADDPAPAPVSEQESVAGEPEPGEIKILRAIYQMTQEKRGRSNYGLRELAPAVGEALGWKDPQDCKDFQAAYRRQEKRTAELIKEITGIEPGGWHGSTYFIGSGTFTQKWQAAFGKLEAWDAAQRAA